VDGLLEIKISHSRTPCLVQKKKASGWMPQNNISTLNKLTYR
jgi:hypothetical protein